MMIMKWQGITASQYDEVRKIVNWEGNRPKGAIFHVASFGDNALHVTDIWESADDFNDFVQNRLMPGVMQVDSTHRAAALVDSLGLLDFRLTGARTGAGGILKAHP